MVDRGSEYYYINKYLLENNTLDLFKNNNLWLIGFKIFFFYNSFIFMENYKNSTESAPISQTYCLLFLTSYTYDTFVIINALKLVQW
jgi:hypothetical protein